MDKVLDVGCGEGSLISCLCNPAPWLPPPLPSILETFARPLHQSTEGSAIPDSTADASQSYLEYAPETFLNPTKVMGLDISSSELEAAIQDTAPSDWRTRWQPLEVEIWEGGLEVVNAAFAGVDCIVATEVYACDSSAVAILSPSFLSIEHLPEGILDYFAPVLLGAYQPRLLLITTPSYTFNARFTAPDAPPSARSGYLDPTKRTDRIFRHHDHKFEWTPEEFTAWCSAAGATWGYGVELDGVGKATEKDEWGRDEALGYASQVAAFKRKDGEGWDERRRVRFEQARDTLGSVEGQHKLLAVHRHIAHEKASQPLPLLERGEVVKCTLTDMRFSALTLGDLWWEERVAAACGGWMELLAVAIANHEGLQLDMSEKLPMSEWTVKLKNGLPEDESPLGPESEETYDMMERSPSMSDSDESNELVTPFPLEEGVQPGDDHLWSDIPQCHSRPTSPWPLSDTGSVWDNADSQNQGWGAGADWDSTRTSPLEPGTQGW